MLTFSSCTLGYANACVLSIHCYAVYNPPFHELHFHSVVPELAAMYVLYVTCTDVLMHSYVAEQLQISYSVYSISTIVLTRSHWRIYLYIK